MAWEALLNPDLDFESRHLTVGSNLLEPQLCKGFPRTWGGLALCFVDCFPGARGWSETGPETVQQTQVEALAWRDKACTHPPHKPVPQLEREAFQNWIKARWWLHTNAWRTAQARANGWMAKLLKVMGLNSLVPKDQGVKDSDFKCDMLLRNGLAAARDDLALLCDGEAGSREMPADIAELAQDLAWGEYSHQAFGYGEEVQDAASEHSDKILLFEAATNMPLMWMFGDCGKYQVWISSYDLKAGLWDKAFATLEGG